MNLSFKSLTTQALLVSTCAWITIGCDDPNVLPPQDFVGGPFDPKPLPDKDVFYHTTYGNGSTFSTTMHSDHYNSDVMPFAGPLGNNPAVRFEDMGLDPGGLCSTPRFTATGNIVVPCQDGDLLDRKRKLVLMDQNLNILAQSGPGVWTGAANATTGVPGGVYLHVRADGSILNGSDTMKVEQFDVDGFAYVRTEIRNLDALSTGDALFEVAEDNAGNLWFVTVGDIGGGALVGYIEAGDWATNPVHTFPRLAGETTENGFAIGENGIFVLTDTRLYGFHIDSGNNIVKDWDYIYDNTTAVRPEFTSTGSGSTPTLLGDDLIAITDDAAGQVNLVVLRREVGAYAGNDNAADRIVCKVPLFQNGASVSDVSPIGYDNGTDLPSLVVSNWSGVDPASEIGGVPVPPVFGNMRGMAGGMSRYDLNGRNPGAGCAPRVWHRPDVAYTTVAKLSTATGLIYTYTQDTSYTAANAYYFEAIDFEDGTTAFKKLTGSEKGGLFGTEYANGMLTLAIGPNGAVYQGVFGGIVKLKDQ